MNDPACMTPDELATWRDQAERFRLWFARNGTLDPCADCTMAFHLEMTAQDRCNGQPGRVETKPRTSTDARQIARREQQRLAARRWRERNPGRRGATTGLRLDPTG